MHKKPPTSAPGHCRLALFGVASGRKKLKCFGEERTGPAPRPQPGGNCTMMPASSLPSLPPTHPGDGSLGPGGSPLAPTCMPPPAFYPLVPRPSDLRSQAAHSGSYRVPRSEAMAVGCPDWRDPPLPASQGSECVWVSQTPSGPSVCSRQDPRADHGLPASVSPAGFHRGLPPALRTGHMAIRHPRLFPGCRASEAVDPIPLQCPHVCPPRGPRCMPQVRTRDPLADSSRL